MPWQQALLVLLLTALLSACTATTGLFFYPQTVWISTPADADLHYEDVWLKAADGTQLHSWWLPAQGEEPDSGIMVLYLHGNAENISSHSRSIYWLPASGVSVLALDYRGFGASAGLALLPAVLQDVEAAAAWLRSRFPHKKLIVLGAEHWYRAGGEFCCCCRPAVSGAGAYSGCLVHRLRDGGP